MAGLDSSLQYILYNDFQNNVSEALILFWVVNW